MCGGGQGAPGSLVEAGNAGKERAGSGIPKVARTKGKKGIGRGQRGENGNGKRWERYFYRET